MLLVPAEKCVSQYQVYGYKIRYDTLLTHRNEIYGYLAGLNFKVRTIYTITLNIFYYNTLIIQFKTQKEGPLYFDYSSDLCTLQCSS